MARSSTWMVLSLGLVACGSETTLMRQTQLDTFEQVPNDEVDILFVVDDSNSMAEEQDALARGFQGFMSRLEEANSKFHLGVISTSAETGDPRAGKLLGEPAVLDVRDDYLSGFRDRVQVGTAGSDKEKGLYAATRALSPEMLDGPNRGFLRPEARLLVTFVTDEEDCSDGGVLDGQEAVACYQQEEQLTPVEAVHRELVAAKGGHEDLVTVGAIIGPRGDARCETAWPGERYAELAIRTNGTIGDICSSDWSDMLYTLGLTASGVRDAFTLSSSAVPESLVVTVDAIDVPPDPRDGFTYDTNTLEVRFHGDAVPPRGALIEVEYEILTGL